MKQLEFIKKAVTIVTLILLSIDLLTPLDVFPYALLGLCIFEFIKAKEYSEEKQKGMCIFSIAAGIAAVVGFIFMFISRI